MRSNNDHCILFCFNATAFIKETSYFFKRISYAPSFWRSFQLQNHVIRWNLFQTCRNLYTLQQVAVYERPPAWHIPGVTGKQGEDLQNTTGLSPAAMFGKMFGFLKNSRNHFCYTKYCREYHWTIWSAVPIQ